MVFEGVNFNKTYQRTYLLLKSGAIKIVIDFKCVQVITFKPFCNYVLLKMQRQIVFLNFDAFSFEKCLRPNRDL